MSKVKAKKVTNSVVIPTSSNEIDSSIDMKLSKQDLIDMVIEETRETLEIKCSELSAEVLATEDEFNKELNLKAKEVTSFLESKFSKELSQVDALGKRETETRECGIITEKGLAFVDSSYEDEEAYDHYAARRENRYYYNVVTAINVNNQVPKKKKVEILTTINVCLSLNKEEANKIYASTLKAAKALSELNLSLKEVRRQLNSVDKMGKKAKGQLIKRILESSSEGKAVLTNMSGIRTNVAQMLIKSATSQTN